MAKDEKTAIVIDDKEYTADDLTDQQKQLVNHVADLDRKIRSARFNLEQLQFGRDAFFNHLKSTLTVESDQTS